MSEEWRAIPGWEGCYEASTLGSVRSLPRKVIKRDGVSYRVAGKVLRPIPRTARDGRTSVALSRHGIARPCGVAQLVALTFLGPRPEGLYLCHNDGDCQNNALANLRYDTPSANQHDAVRHGTHSSTRRTQCKRGHDYSPRSGRNGRTARYCRICNRGRWTPSV